MKLRFSKKGGYVKTYLKETEISKLKHFAKEINKNHQVFNTAIDFDKLKSMKIEQFQPGHILNSHWHNIKNKIETEKGKPVEKEKFQSEDNKSSDITDEKTSNEENNISNPPETKTNEPKDNQNKNQQMYKTRESKTKQIEDLNLTSIKKENEKPIELTAEKKLKLIFLKLIKLNKKRK